MTVDPLQPPEGWLPAAPGRMDIPGARGGLLLRSASSFARVFGRNEIPDVLTVMNRHPGLFWPWLLFASRLMPFGRLSGREREMVILRTGWNCRSRYEWGQHVDIALRIGVPDADIVCLARTPERLTAAHERDLMQACDELCADNVVSDATWGRLAAHYNDRHLIEILMLIGHYRMIAGFLNSAGLALEPPVEARLQAFHQRIGATG